MKKTIFSILMLLFAINMMAQVPFEGVITMKVMTSYSSRLIKGAPFLNSFGDTCEVMIKGDDLHLYYKTCGLHRVVKDNRIYCWNEKTLNGFDMPVFSTKAEGTQWIETNGTKIVRDVPTHLHKKFMTAPSLTTEEEGWFADEKPVDISLTALQNLSTTIFANYLYPMDFGNLLCMKYSGRMHADARWEAAMNLVPATGVTNSVAGNDMEQAKNAATNETAASFAFEVLSITPQHMDEDYYVIPANITFKSQQDSPTVREYATLFFSEMYPSMHAMHKGPMGKAIFEMSVKSMAEALNKQAVARGQKPEDMVAASFYTISDAVLSVERKNLEKQAQKQQKKAKGNKANKEDEKAVVYDINEEWDF